MEYGFVLTVSIEKMPGGEMEAKDTVMGNKKLQLLGQQYEDDLPTYSLNHYLLLAQAEISFKAGVESLLAELNSPSNLILAARQEGRREVVEWMRVASVVKHYEYTDDNGKKWMGVSFCITPKQWQAKLKEWGL